VKRTISRWLRRAADRIALPPVAVQPTILAGLAQTLHVYTVTAYRWGNLDGPSYPVGCYATADEAVQAAQDEEADRGGKYGCEVVEWTVGVGIKERGGLYPFGESGSPVRIVRSPEA
jgi:hypothetical protein